MVAGHSGLTNPFSCGAPKTTAGHLLLVPRSQQSVYNQKKTRRFHALVFFWILLRNSLRLSSILSSSIKFTKRFSDPLKQLFQLVAFPGLQQKPCKKPAPQKKNTSALLSDDVSKVALNILPSNMVTVSTMPSIALTSPADSRLTPSDWVPSSYIIIFIWYKPMLFGVTIILQGWPLTGTDKQVAEIRSNKMIWHHLKMNKMILV